MCKWICKSNRPKHFVGGAILGLIFTIFCSLGAAGGMEFKDKQWGGSWDWLDFLATILGGLVGQAAQALAIYLIFFAK